jgi:hypothetical protein
MNNTQQTVRVGLFFLLGCALAWITFESLSGGQIFKKSGYTVIAPFSNLKGLKEGDEVLMAGVKIGSVAATRLGNQRVEAVLTIDPTVAVPNDAAPDSRHDGCDDAGSAFKVVVFEQGIDEGAFPGLYRSNDGHADHIL